MRLIHRDLRRLFLCAAVLVFGPAAGARADFIFETNGSAGTIGEFTTDGQVVNASLISGLYDPTIIALDGEGDLFVNTVNGVGEYTTSGATVNASLIPMGGGFEATAIACDGNGHLFIGDSSNGIIREYSTSGTLLNYSLISGVSPNGPALDGHGHIFEADGSGKIEEFTTSGTVLSRSVVNGLNVPVGIALDGNGHIFVANNGGHTFGEYTTEGVPVDLTSFEGVSATGLAIETVPEPGALLVAALASTALLPGRPSRTPKDQRLI